MSQRSTQTVVCIVTWTLEPTSAGRSTQLSLIQEGFGPEDGEFYQLLEKG